MSSNSKGGKHSKALPTMLDEDRISNLPSCLIVKIISLLPTKDVVATSALSPKWKKMWTSVTSLEFADKSKAPSSAIGFERFVNRVLLLHDKSSCLQSFRMKCEGYYNGSVVNTWIASILPCDIEELDLSIPVVDSVFFPTDLFLCKNLVVLKLGARGKVIIPNSLYLPVLKTLHLSEVILSDDVSIVRLLSGCPVLEELKLSRCIGKNVGVVNITAPALTSLTLEFLPYYDDDALIIHYKYQVCIDTPYLKYLYLSGFNPQGYVLKNLNHLIKAEIHTGYLCNDGFIENCKLLSDIFNGISQVRSIVLSRVTTEAICYSGSVLPKFSNLTYFKLQKVYESWKHMLKLLENLPHLETLHIQESGYGIHIYPPIDVALPSCLQTHLKIIKVDIDCGKEEHDMEMIEYFLRNAKVLEKLTIDYQPVVPDTEAYTRFLYQLLMCPRGSNICKVEVLQLLLK